MADHAAMFRGPAEIYDRFVGRYSPRLARAMCEAADVREGQRVLDVGCGSGALVAELAGIVGAEGVAGIDPSEPFVEASRAAHLGRASSSDRPSQSPSQTHAEAGLLLKTSATTSPIRPRAAWLRP